MKRGLLLLPLLWLACSTDNGDNVFGPQFGPNGANDASADGAPITGDDDGGGTTTDGGGDDGASGDSAVPCTAGTVGVLAGGDAALTGAIRTGNGAWTGAAISGGSATDKPALVAFGSGFLGVTRGTGDVLVSTAYTTSWSTATTFGNSGVKGPPALTVVGTSAHLVYSAGSGPNRDYAHGIHDGNAWNTADAIVGTGVANDHSFGTVGAGLGTAGTTVVFVENGTDYNLYTRTFDSAWSGATQITGASSIGADVPTPPVLVSATTAWDVVAVYVAKTTRRLSYATRDSGTKAWTDRGVIHDFATTNEPFTFARISSSSYVVAFRGQDNNGYYANGTVNGSGGITWTAAQSIGGGGPVAVDATPAIAKGICGDDAIVVYATSSTVKATRLRGTTWTPAENVTGASGGHVAVAVR